MLLQITSFDTFLYSQSALAVVLILAVTMLWREYISEKKGNDKLRDTLISAKDESYAKIIDLTRSSIESQHEIITIVKDMVESIKVAISGQQHAINDALDKRSEIIIARLSERIGSLERILNETTRRQ